MLLKPLACGNWIVFIANDHTYGLLPPEQLSKHLEIVCHMGVTGIFADKKGGRQDVVWGVGGVASQSLVINQREPTWFCTGH